MHLFSMYFNKILYIFLDLNRRNKYIIIDSKNTILQNKIFCTSLSGCDERRELKNAITENKCQRKT